MRRSNLLVVGAGLLALIASNAQAALSNSQFTKLAERIVREDENGADAGQVKLRYGGRIRHGEKTDKASGKLFVSVDGGLMKRPTYHKLAALYPFFTPSTTERESGGNNKQRAIDEFIEEILSTKVMKHTREALANAGFAQAADEKSWREFVHEIWFYEYSRGVARSSSGFEHVFMHDEDKDGRTGQTDVKGMHNWVRAYWAEREGSLDYAGYSKKSDNAMDITMRVGSGRTYWKQSTMFVRTSPELEMALYTACFAGKRTTGNRMKCVLALPSDCTPIEIVAHEQRVGSRKVVGTAYPRMGSGQAKGCRVSGLSGGRTGAAAANNGAAWLIAALAALLTLDGLP